MASNIFLFPLTEEEDKKPLCTGLAYALKNEARWIPDTNDFIDKMVIAPSYNRDTTFFVIENVSYAIFKYYVDVTNQRVVYLLRPTCIGPDKVVENITETTPTDNENVNSGESTESGVDNTPSENA